MNKKFLAEFVGTFLLISVIVGSGIMGVNLSNGNDALALLANAISTGSILYVIITLFSPVSGASFNPAITFLDYLEKKIDSKILIIYWLNQILGGLVGVFFIHFIFELEIVQFSNNDRYGVSIWMSELVSTLTLLLVVKVGS